MSDTQVTVMSIADALEALGSAVLEHPGEKLTLDDYRSLIMDFCLNVRIGKDQLPPALAQQLASVEGLAAGVRFGEPTITLRKDILFRSVLDAQLGGGGR